MWVWGALGYNRACGVPKREREARSDLRTSSPLHLADDSTLALTGGLLRRPEHPPEPRMPRAYSDELAWRVILRWREYGHSVTQISDPEHGLDVSRAFVYDVIKRYEMTGDVKTHQGHGADPLASCALTRYEDHQIVALIIKSPRVTLKEHRAQFLLDTGVLVSYSVFCRAVARLGYSRKVIRGLAYQCE